MSVDQASFLFDSLVSEFVCGDIVLIGGFSRSGKTTFAEHLRLAFVRRGLNTWNIPLDSWLKDVDVRTPSVMGRYDLVAIRKFYRCVMPVTFKLNN